MRELRELIRAYLARLAVHQSGAILSLLYWSVVVPTAVVARLSGRRLLPSTFGTAKSHWIARAPFAKDRESLSRQF